MTDLGQARIVGRPRWQGRGLSRAASGKATVFCLADVFQTPGGAADFFSTAGAVPEGHDRPRLVAIKSVIAAIRPRQCGLHNAPAGNVPEGQGQAAGAAIGLPPPGAERQHVERAGGLVVALRPAAQGLQARRRDCVVDRADRQ